MKKIDVKVKLLSEEAQLPVRMTEHAAGYDLHSSNVDPIIIEPGKLKLIPTGLSIELPVGYEAQIRPRSGLALKNSIGVLNSPGTIDADYRGHVQVILFNFGDKDFKVIKGERIAQMVLCRHETADFELVRELNGTERGAGGFGHTSKGVNDE